MPASRFMLVLALPALAFHSRLAPGAAPSDLPERHPVSAVPIEKVVLGDGFWADRLETARRVTLRDVFDKFEKEGTFENFDKIRDGKAEKHIGPPWYDGLVYETIRAAADFHRARPDPEMEKRVDGYIERIAAAALRDSDGYLNTYTQLEEPDHRWGTNGGNDNWQHDCYNAGALVEAGVHWWRATGKTRLLEVATRLANHMADVMGPAPKKNVVPGHSLAEEAVIKLHRLFVEHPDLAGKLSVPVDPARYLTLVEFWLENRGRTEGRRPFESYAQDHQPLLEQPTAEGHAVRATLLYAGLVAAAQANGREDYYRAALRLWENMVGRKMHVTGGLGAIAGHEGFGPDFFLPSNAYLETCAAVGAGFFHHRMQLAFGDGRYSDELERALYNGVICGVSLAGDSYFYENPLEAKRRPRWSWHGCPCCPPMLLKILAALPEYVYAVGDRRLQVNLYAASRMSTEFGGVKVALEQSTRYPWAGAVKFHVNPESPLEFTLALRKPSWCREAAVAVNGTPCADARLERGLLLLRRNWKAGDTVDLDLSMPVERIVADPRVEATRGRVALQRGPLIYCLEGIDNDGHVRNLVLERESILAAEARPDLLGGVTVVRGQALAIFRDRPSGDLYRARAGLVPPARVELTAVPFYANSNRELGEMAVWIAECAVFAQPQPLPGSPADASASASHCFEKDTVEALNDGVEPARSDDAGIPRMTFWDHKGTREWVAYEFAKPLELRAAEVYWWDERRIGAHCRVPRSWSLLWKDGETWKPVKASGSFGTDMDRFNRVEFEAVRTTGIRLELELAPDASAGILEWRVE